MKNKLLTVLWWVAVIISLLIGIVMMMYGLLADITFILFCGIVELGVSAYIYERFLDRHKN